MDTIRFRPELKNLIKDVVSVLEVQQNWGLSYIDAEVAWKHSKGENVKVAIIDTGWCAHKDLNANFLQGYDATGNNDYIDHGSFHACHVSGIIGANCGDGFGVMGIAPNCKLIPIKSLNDDGTGSYDYIVKALQIVKDLDVDLINMSLGSPVAPDNDVIHSLIQEISNQGKIVVCASGNDGQQELNFPARYDESISVAAVDQSGNLAKFSSTGVGLDTAAPGVNIYSTYNNNQYVLLTGTSMACPCITGMLALIISRYKANPQLNFAINQKNITKLLFDLGGPEGQHIIQAGLYDIGVPKFANMIWGDNA